MIHQTKFRYLKWRFPHLYKLHVRFKGIPHLPKTAEIQVQYLQMSNENHPGCLGCFGGLYYPQLYLGLQ